MADKLTPQQAMAVTDRGGKLLVSAAAGSGKTKVLVDRLLRYLTDPDDPANLDEFLIITYTKAAASELRGKIAAKLTQAIAEDPDNRHLQKQMQRLFLTKISTVHGFCGDILREYAYRLDIAPDFRVADENECREIRNQVMTDLLDRAYTEVDADFRTFVDTQGLGRTDMLVPEILEKVYNSALCHLDPEAWLQKCLDATQVESLEDVSQTPWGAYLLKDLHEYLDAQLHVMQQCVAAAKGCEGMEKAVMNLQDTVYQLEKLRNCATWDETVSCCSIDYGRLTFPRKNPDPELTERIKAARGACKKNLEKKLRGFTDDSAQIFRDFVQSASGTRGLISLVKRFDEAFRQAKKSRRVLDFSDLEHRTLDILLGKSRSNPTATAREIGRRFREIMVDEYQDSNAVQDAIFSVLTAERNNCFMVGDVKQSIYQFRLADPGIFLEKYHAYIPAEEATSGEGRKVLLSHNFRSGIEVIEGVNHVFSTCMSERVGGLQYGDAEALREGVPRPPLGRPGVELHALEIREDTYAEEAAYVAQKICSLLNGGAQVRASEGMRDVELDDIVILLRSPGSVGAQFQRALEAKGIRCSTGGGDDLLQTEEIATLRSFLQTIVNPRQDIPLISALASPLFGFTADDLAHIRSRKKRGSVYDALWESNLPKAVNFLTLLSELRKEARMCTLTQLLESCFRRTRIDSIYGAMPGGDVRRANLQEFYQLAVSFEMGTLRDLGQFLEHLDALEEKGLVSSSSGGTGAVRIMSIHKSKGLEFPVVFLCGLSRKFNRESLQARILCDKELGLGLSVADAATRTRYPSAAKRAIAVKMAQESLSEEMRVLYVAMTRARDVLIMTYAQKNLASELQDISARMDFDDGALLCQDASCPGIWVVLSAMKRMEAGELHQLGGRPQKLQMSETPWLITVSESEETEGSSGAVHEERCEFPAQMEEYLKDAISYSYPHISATMTPSKQTATNLKGRFKDAEAAELTPEPKSMVRAWRRPSFMSEERSGTAYGTAMHAALQFIRYANCTSEEAIVQEVERLVAQGFLSAEQGAMVDVHSLLAFFNTEIGQKLVSGIDHIREFKFSILDDASWYGQDLKGEQVLLQGVVDCALMEEDGITVLDFKTDRVGKGDVSFVLDKYRSQVEAYAQALSRIYEMPVKEKYLYLFRINEFVPV